jgi:hypothetical protein
MKISVFITLQNIGILAAWIVLATYVHFYTIIILAIIIISQIFLLRFTFGLSLTQMNQDAVIDGVPDTDTDADADPDADTDQFSEPLHVFWIGVLTSWMCPTTVWSNNIINKYNNSKELNEKLDSNISALNRFQGTCQQVWNCLKCLTCLVCRRGCLSCRRSKAKEDNIKENIKGKNFGYKKRTKILMVTSAATILALFVSLIIIMFLLKWKDLTFTVEDNPPVTHCTKFRSGLAPGKLKANRERE